MTCVNLKCFSLCEKKQSEGAIYSMVMIKWYSKKW